MISEQDRDYLFQKLNEMLDKIKNEGPFGFRRWADDPMGREIRLATIAGMDWAIQRIREEVQKVL